MKKYRTIYADPPWKVERGGPRIGANHNKQKEKNK